MFAFDLEGRKMVSVALRPNVQQALATRAKNQATSLQFELRKLLDDYPINGFKPGPAFKGAVVHRFVPVRKDVVELAERFAAGIECDAGDVLGDILAQEIEKPPKPL